MIPVLVKNNFIFHYSPRPGTVAIERFEDDVPRSVKKERLNALLSLTGDLSAKVHSGYKGKTVDVFVEKISPQSTKNQVELKWAEDRV